MNNMESDRKLAGDVQALLKAAGFVDLTTQVSEAGATVSGRRGESGAVFHLATQVQNRAIARRTEAGGREPDADTHKAIVRPSFSAPSNS